MMEQTIEGKVEFPTTYQMITKLQQKESQPPKIASGVEHHTEEYVNTAGEENEKKSRSDGYYYQL